MYDYLESVHLDLLLKLINTKQLEIIQILQQNNGTFVAIVKDNKETINEEIK